MYQQCIENPIYVFPEMKLLGLVSNFHIHAYVNDLYIPMNVGIRNEATQFHFLDYLFQIFVTVCLQCTLPESKLK